MRISLICSMVCFVFLTGCMAKSEQIEYYKPINILQQEFYDIQTLFETGKYKDTIELGEIFLNRYPRDILSISTQYYVAASYQKTGDFAKAEAIYQNILKNHPDDDWGKLAQVGIIEIKDAK